MIEILYYYDSEKNNNEQTTVKVYKHMQMLLLINSNK